MNCTITITGDKEVQEQISDIAGAVKDRAGLHRKIADEARVLISEHLRARNLRSVPRPGWKPSGYWGEASEATTAASDETAATITVSKKGIRLHLHGGTVKSNRPGGKLAIPLRAELAGVNPREAFPDRKGAFVLSSKGRGESGRAFLAYREGNALRLAYILLSSVTLKPDATVLPPADRLASVARRAIKAVISGQ